MKPNSENNIYFLTLEFGVKNISKGISFNQLLEYLKSKSVLVEDNFMPYFRYWFYESFFIQEVYPSFQSTNTIERQSALNNDYLKAQDDKLAIITGTANQSHLEFIELKFAYKSSKTATKIAIASLMLQF